MVHELNQEQSNYRSRLSYFKGMNGIMSRQERSSSLDRVLNPQLPKGDDAKENRRPSDIDLMKEKFAKLLLGEDMSGGGKGVSSALALSNSITNLAASVFGELKRLDPMSSDQKSKWRKEINWLLSATDHIVEFSPSQQNTNGVNMEIMTTKQRSDLQMNIPALRKLDAMLIECLDNFKDQKEFCYLSKDETSDKNRKDDKWWLPMCRVPSKGLPEMSRTWLKFQKDSVNQVHKAAKAINAQVLSEMEIPENYIESLPKSGKSSLGESIYKCITDEYFDPEQLLSITDLSTEHKILDLKNRIEASIVIWKRKLNNKDTKSAWSPGISLEKRERFEDRAQTILLILKHRYPGIPQSALDISKIQYNADVGHAILESYSRIIENLAFTIMSRIENVLYADHMARNPSQDSFKRKLLQTLPSMGLLGKFPSFQEEMLEIKSSKMPNSMSMTLLDFMGWNRDQDSKEKKDSAGNESLKLGEQANKILNVVTIKKANSYLETLGGLKSPTSRH